MQLVSIEETLYCHPELDSGSLNTLIDIDPEIGDPERDAETEGPEFSSGSIQHDIFRHFSFPQQKLIMNKGNEQIPPNIS